MPKQRNQAAVIQREVRIEASTETVFRFFTDPEKIVRWMGLAATLNPRPGGVFSLNIMGNYVMEGEYVHVEPAARVVLTWGYANAPWESTGSANPLPPGSSTVEVVLVPDGDATIVRLTHRDLPEDLESFHAFGWDHYLARLVVVGEGGDPGPDAMAAALELEP